MRVGTFKGYCDALRAGGDLEVTTARNQYEETVYRLVRYFEYTETTPRAVTSGAPGAVTDAATDTVRANPGLLRICAL
jgi:hypothetical protein